MGRPGKPVGLCGPDPSRPSRRGHAGTRSGESDPFGGGAGGGGGGCRVLSLVHAHGRPPKIAESLPPRRVRRQTLSPSNPQAHACGLPGRPPSALRRPNPPDLLELLPGRRSQILPHRDFRAHAFQRVDQEGPWDFAARTRRGGLGGETPETLTRPWKPCRGGACSRWSTPPKHEHRSREPFLRGVSPGGPSPSNPQARACGLPGRPPYARRRPNPTDLLELLPGRRGQILPHRDFRASSHVGWNAWAGLRRGYTVWPASPRPPGTLSVVVRVKLGSDTQPRVSPASWNPFPGAEVGFGPVAGSRSDSRWSTPPGDAHRSREPFHLGGSPGRPSPSNPQAHACGLPGRPPYARRRPNPTALLELLPGRRSQIRPHRDFRAHAFQWVDQGMPLLICTNEPPASKRPEGNLPCTRGLVLKRAPPRARSRSPGPAAGRPGKS